MLVIFSLSFLFLQFLFVSVCAVTPRDARHLGCFSTSLVNSYDYYRLRQALTWHNGLTVCIERLVMYMGVQREQGFSDENFYYCGNDLLDNSERLNSSECETCMEDAERQCGGYNSMSLYKLRDSTPLQLLLGTGNSGVKVWTDDGSPSATKVPCDGAVSDIDYIYTDDVIYFGYRQYWAKSTYSHFALKYGSIITIHDYGSDSGVGDLANDWVRKQIYASSIYTYNIYEKHVDDKQSAIPDILASRASLMRDMAIDPYARETFFVETTGDMFYISLENKQVGAFSQLGKLYISDIMKMALDTNEELIYVVGKMEGQNNIIVRVDYDDSVLKLVFNGSSQLSDVRSVDVFRSTLVWVNFANGLYTVYKCQLTPKCKESQMIYQSSEAIHDLKIYNPERQTPGRKYLCANLDCSYDCVKTSMFVAKCTCPSGKQLSPDGKTCQEKPTTTTALTTLVSSSDGTFLNEEHRLTEDISITMPPSDSEPHGTTTFTKDIKEKSNIEIFEKLQNIHEHLQKVQEDKHLSTRTSFSGVFFSIVALLGLAFLAIMTYMQIKIHRRGVVVRSNPTELVQVSNNLIEVSESSEKSGLFQSGI